jgi:hypothetical protein
LLAVCLILHRLTHSLSRVALLLPPRLNPFILSSLPIVQPSSLLSCIPVTRHHFLLVYKHAKLCLSL